MRVSASLERLRRTADNVNHDDRNDHDDNEFEHDDHNRSADKHDDHYSTELRTLLPGRVHSATTARPRLRRHSLPELPCHLHRSRSRPSSL